MKESNARIATQNQKAQQKMAKDTVDATKKVTAAQETFVARSGETGKRFITTTKEQAAAIAGPKGFYEQLHGRISGFVVENEQGARQIISQNRKLAESLSGHGLDVREFSLAEEKLRSLSSATAPGIVAFKNLGNQTEAVAEDLKRVKPAAEQLPTGRLIRGGLAGAGAFSQLGRSIAYASGTFLAFAVVSGILRSSVQAAAQFGESLSRIVGLAGGARAQVEKFGQSILTIAPKIGRGPRELADALYFIASAGIAASKQMDVLTVSAKASVSGLGETKVVADAVTSAINAYGAANLTAAKATDVLVDTVHYGKGEAASFAPVIGTVASFAAALGVQFHEVGAALAAMTRLGIPAYTAAIELQAVFTNILHPTKTAETALQGLAAKAGLARYGFKQLLNQLSTGGLLSVLTTLRKIFKNNDAAMASVFTNVRALRGVLAITGKSAGATAEIFRKMAGNTHALAIAFNVASKDPAQRFRAFQATLESLEIAIGNALLPTVLKVGDALGKWLGKPGNIERLNETIQHVANAATQLFRAVVAVSKPLLGLITIAKDLVGSWETFFKIFLAGWLAIKLRGRLLPTAGLEEKKQELIKTQNWINQHLRSEPGRIRAPFMAGIEQMRAGIRFRDETPVVRALRQSGGGFQFVGPAGVISPDDISAFRSVRASLLGLEGGGRQVRVRIVEDFNLMGRAAARAGDAFAKANQASMQAQQRFGRAQPGAGGFLNALLGTPTRQRDAAGRYTTQLVRENRTTFASLANSFSQNLMREQQRLSRASPGIGGFINALLGTPTRQQNELGQFTSRLARENRVTMSSLADRFSQELMRQQQRLSRTSPGIGGLLNALFGTPTRQQNELGRFTSRLARERTTTFASLNQQTMAIQQQVGRAVPGGSTILNALLGTPTRQQDELGRFTTQLRREGSVWARLMQQFGRQGGGRFAFGPGFDPGPIRQSMLILRSLFVTTARTGLTAFSVMFEKIAVTARTTATVIWVSFRFAILSIARLLGTALLTIGWGALIIGLTEVIFNLGKITSWLFKTRDAAKAMNDQFVGLNRNLKETASVIERISRTRSDITGALVSQGAARGNVRTTQVAVGAAKSDNDRAAAKARLAAATEREFAANKRLLDLVNKLAALEAQREKLARGREAQAQKAANALRVFNAGVQKGVDALRNQLPGRFAQPVGHPIQDAIDNLKKQLPDEKGVAKTIDTAALKMLQITRRPLTAREQRIIIRFAVRGKTPRQMIQEALRLGADTEGIRLRGGALEAARRQFTPTGASAQTFRGFALPFVPGQEGSQFALPQKLLLQQAQAAATGSQAAVNAVNKKITAYIRGMIKELPLTDKQKTDAFNMIASLISGLNQFAVKTKLQLRQAQAELSGSPQAILAAEVAIRNWIMTTIKAGKHTDEWTTAAVQALKGVNDSIVSSLAELPLGTQLKIATASATKSTTDDIAAARQAIKDINAAIAKVKNDPKLSKAQKTTALIALQNELATYTQQVTSATKKQFQIPMKLQIDEAKAAVTGTIQAQQSVNSRIVRWIRQQIASGKLHGDALVQAYNELGNRVRQSIADHANLIKTAIGQITSAIDDAKNAIGDIFAGPIIAPTDLQRRATLGLTAPIGKVINQDIKAQTRQANTFFNDLDKLRKKGVPKGTLQEIAKQGVTALPYVQALLGMSPKDFKAFLAQAQKREALARKIAVMNLQANNVNLFAKQIVAGMTTKQLQQFTDTGRLPPNVNVYVNGVKQTAKVKHTRQQRRGGVKSSVPSSIGAWINT